ncbi:unnamed protein product [Peronospora belbahrii]|uniref:Uncharacterized protein n=1 Tax=Peronospora belbahrii TaxID=622444 RepID=A0AAU9L6T5_9STRA|nr:unnamed protein product [Peronospora belbahrii]CAH0522603.1 unnamed protein product [Peronospora belbahrii]
MLIGAYDRRGSSIAVDVDDAIERIVEQFESRDLALRLDVLRALSAQAQLAFETTRVRERLGQHPVSMDLIQGITCQSLVYKTLTKNLKVDSYSCAYDVERNVVMTTTVRWTLGSPPPTKKRKKMSALAPTKKKEMITKYRYERMRQKNEEEETFVKFSVIVSFGDDDVMPRELLCFEMACQHLYPKRYYEEKRQFSLVDSKEIDGEENTKENEEGCDMERGDGETFGEEQREFCFNNEVLADMGEWMGADKEELDPVDVAGFFMALPVYEDEWLIDERVCEILFQGEIGADSSNEDSNEKDEDEGDDELKL